MRWQGWVLAGLVSVVLTACAGNVKTVMIGDVVPRCLGDDLELAVTPWPQEAALTDRMMAVTRLVVTPTPQYAHPFTIRDVRLFLYDLEHLAPALAGAANPEAKAQREAAYREAREAALAAPAPAAPLAPPAVECRLCFGELGDGGPADRLVTQLQLAPDAARRQVMTAQGYIFYAGPAPDDGAPVVAVAGVGAAGTYYGLQTFKQLVVYRNGQFYVRQGRLTDWPVMPWRGSKRPEAWEDAFKANYGRPPNIPDEEAVGRFRVFGMGGSDPQRELKSHEVGRLERTRSPGLDASDAFIEQLFARWKDDYTRNLGKAAKLFMVKSDDMELLLDRPSGTYDRFQGNAGRAYLHFLTELNKRLKALDPECTLYWMPNPYYPTAFEFGPMAAQIREAGGLPSTIGLWWTGHFVFSPVMTVADLRGYQQAFYGPNPITVKGVIYDNHGRITEPTGRLSDYFPMPRRDPGIAACINGFYNERGSWVNRITSYDFHWNPERYEPDRALKLALRELANRDPDYYRVLEQFCRTWEAGRYPPSAITTHDDCVRQQQELAARLQALLPQLEATGGKALATVFSTGRWEGHDYRWRFYQQVLQDVREQVKRTGEWLPKLWCDAAGPAWLIAPADAPTIDGKLDEAVYRRNPTFDRFVTSKVEALKDPAKPATPDNLWFTLPEGPVPEDISTKGWWLCDGRNLYVAFQCRDHAWRPVGPNELPRVREKVGNDNQYNWRHWCLDIGFDVRHDHQNFFHLIVDPLGQVTDEYLGWPGDPLPTGPAWTVGQNLVVRKDGDHWLFEAAIPLETIGLKDVKDGDVWGHAIMRRGMNVTSFSTMFLGTGPYGIRYPQIFGHFHWRR